MPNSIRTPKPNTPQHIKEAVDNEEWQRFRLSLKGTSTHHKLRMLKAYLNDGSITPEERGLRRIRTDNYLKALSRGGQIKAPYYDTYIMDLNADCLEVRK